MAKTYKEMSKQGAIGLAMAIVMISCKQSGNKTENKTVVNHEAILFAKGEKITNDNFTGTAYLQMLIDADSLNQTTVGNVTFEPGARTKWHSHPAGQVLLVTDGVGYYQEKGQQKKILRKGDVIKFAPNIVHWHGASTDTAFVQLAITGREKGQTIWLERVTDDEYSH